MVSATRSAISGLRAATRVVEAAASNIANARTASHPDDVVVEQSSMGQKAGSHRTAPRADAYTPVHVVQESVEGGGVKSSLAPITPSHVVVYDPSDRSADAEGRVALPNVDFAREILNMGAAQRAYEAGLRVIETEDKMIGALLDSQNE